MAFVPTRVIGWRNVRPGNTMCLSGSYITLKGGADFILRYTIDDISFNGTSSFIYPKVILFYFLSFCVWLIGLIIGGYGEEYYGLGALPTFVRSVPSRGSGNCSLTFISELSVPIVTIEVLIYRWDIKLLLLIVAPPLFSGSPSLKVEFGFLFVFWFLKGSTVTCFYSPYPMLFCLDTLKEGVM